MMYLTIARKDILYFIYLQLYPHFSFWQNLTKNSPVCCVANATRVYYHNCNKKTASMDAVFFYLANTKFIYLSHSKYIQQN